MEMHMRCGCLSALFHHRPFVLLAPPAAADLTFLPRGSRVLPSDLRIRPAACFDVKQINEQGAGSQSECNC